MRLPPVNPDGFAAFNPQSVFDKDHFLTGLSILLDYFNAGNTPSELYDLHVRSHNWCETYYGHDNFELRPPMSVLAAHPDVFNFSINSRERLRTSDGDSMDTDEAFPTYTEPSLFDDGVISDLMDTLAAEQASAMALCKDGSDTHEPLLAAHLKDTRVVWYIPEMLAHLAKLNLDAITDPHPGQSCFSDCMDTDDVQYATAMSVDTRGRNGSSMSICKTTERSSRTMSLNRVCEETSWVAPECAMTDASLESDRSWWTCNTSPDEDAMVICSNPASNVYKDGEDEEVESGNAMEGVVKTQRFGLVRNVMQWLGARAI